jgi:hypothetical protein
MRSAIPDIPTISFLAARRHLYPVDRASKGLEEHVYCSPVMLLGPTQAHYLSVLSERDVPVMHFRFDGEQWVYQGADWL